MRAWLRTRWEIVALALLAVVCAALCEITLREKSVTIDEFGHVPAGFNYLATGDARFCRLHPPLANVVAALPLLFLDVEPGFGNGLPPELRFGFWENGEAFMHRNAARYHDLFVAARRASVVLLLLAGLVACAFARALVAPPHRAAAGVLAAAMVWFCPNVLAHGTLSTTDGALCLFMPLAGLLFLRWLRAPSGIRLALAAVAVGAAQLTKAAALFLYPAFAVVAVVYAWRAPAGQRRRVLAGFAWTCVLSLVVLSAGYCFQSVGRPLGEYAFVSDTWRGVARFLPAGVPVPAPASWVEALDQQAYDTATRGDPTYLFGASFHGGRWYYFFALLALKVPVPVLLLWVLGAWCCARDRGVPWREQLVLLLPALLLFLAFSFLSEKQIGLRLILPLLPVLAVWVAAHLAPRLASWRWRAPALALGAWLLVDAVHACPHYLPYFNEAAGGPARGDDYASGSNLDWGQDLIALRRWIEEHDAGRIQLLYYGRVDPAVYGIDYEVPERVVHDGLLAVSKTFWTRGYSVQDHGTKTWRGRFRVGEGTKLEKIATLGYSIDVFRVGAGR
jgi:hypothetical protein